MMIEPRSRLQRQYLSIQGLIKFHRFQRHEIDNNRGHKSVSGLESLIYLFVCTTTSTHWMDLLHLQQFLKSKQHESPQETIQALDVVLRDAPSKVGEGDCFDVGRSGEFEVFLIILYCLSPIQAFC
ncbi:uncharacterized protein LOC115695673 [Cannabis sativa]|uniref:uncharacterized protein LOC115695673 n=1 Tax=Cannabis sativa TaxID=3483 RepID=UPI0029C9C20E|nr:uncharacterized protein LOC115695673 [Cannabis sativa]XP_060973179.1 uncharacterized protein LOC115695673 [Cannabis sativa]XP_060973180.1 uncharacterized protein LOC115695673 [Cannabis sativa]XP_060973181.1 uncharacterized protein LOC115695673 [Cannabis sativa]XP_060973182.1 uncharacterized protein LOC115695673 [Cannabis sativa]XP_060973183.1 uncharacterized protein LOC115695673 [Cannabis sativa]